MSRKEGKGKISQPKTSSRAAKRRGCDILPLPSCPEGFFNELADDYVLATGEQHNVREFIEEAFGLCGIKIEWQGAGIEEKGIDPTTGRTLVEIDPAYFRPTEVETLVGDPQKAKEKLGWVHQTSFKELVRMMVEADLKLAGLDPAKIMGS